MIIDIDICNVVSILSFDEQNEQVVNKHVVQHTPLK